MVAEVFSVVQDYCNYYNSNQLLVQLYVSWWWAKKDRNM